MHLNSYNIGRVSGYSICLGLLPVCRRIAEQTLGVPRK
jgi:hypothetical protein